MIAQYFHKPCRKKNCVLIASQKCSGADLKNLDVKVNALVQFLGAL